MFFTHRIRKQIFAVFVYSVLFSLIGWGVWYLFLKEPPTCEDGILNQDEEQIDCGGSVCTPCEAMLLRNLETVSVNYFYASSNFYDLAAKVKNPSNNYGLRNFSYVFTLYDENNEAMATRSGYSYIMPAESKYLIESKVPVDRKVSWVEFKLTTDEKDWFKPETENIPKLLVKNKKLETDKFSGVLVNNSMFKLDKVYVNIVLINRVNKVMAAAKTDVWALNANEERYFLVNWPTAVDASEVSRTEVELEYDIFRNL